MTTDVLSMSDEDFLKLNGPPAADTPAAGTDNQEGQTSAEDQQAAADAAAAEEQAKDETAEAERLAAEEAAAKDTSNSGKVEGEVNGEQGAPGSEATTTDPAAGQAAKDEGGKGEGAAVVPGSEASTETATPDYEGFYKSIMAPIKANGKTIELKDPKEAIQLMQMGANYTRKMQALAPHRKVLMMLENNNLLDEGQLAFAIDLVVKKDPEAIKKLLKDAKVDPLEIDTNVEPTYREGNHRVSDDEAAFVTALDDLRSNQGGNDTLKVINDHWDQASKDVLWKDPSVMQVIHEQRVSGVYDRVAAEVERQKTLGAIPAQVPFLQAYKMVGDQLAQAGKFADLATATTASTATTTAQPVVTRAATPKPAIKNGDKVSAAAATRTTPKTAEVKVNPLSMSDEDFMKQMANRL